MKVAAYLYGHRYIARHVFTVEESLELAPHVIRKPAPYGSDHVNLRQAPHLIAAGCVHGSQGEKVVESKPGGDGLVEDIGHPLYQVH